MGATLVELALVLPILFFFFTAFFQIVEIFIAHERLSYASSITARSYSVSGNHRKTAQSVESDIAIKAGGDTITLEKRIDVPINFENILSKRKVKFKISSTAKTVRQRDMGGDN